MKCNLFPWGSDLYHRQLQPHSVMNPPFPAVGDLQSAHLKIEKRGLQFKKKTKPTAKGLMMAPPWFGGRAAHFPREKLR